jgi:glycerol uptake facilitator-like aquaporin
MSLKIFATQPRYLLPYWLAQVGGGLAASTVHFFLLPTRAASAAYGATIPTVGIAQAIGIETIISFFLMLVSMAAATDRRVNRAVAGLVIGVTVALGGWFAGPLTGGSMNPARSLAPALYAGGKALADVWIYWVGPLLGAILGAVVYEALRGGEEHALEIPVGVFHGLKGARHPGSDRGNVTLQDQEPLQKLYEVSVIQTVEINEPKEE